MLILHMLPGIVKYSVKSSTLKWTGMVRALRRGSGVPGLLLGSQRLRPELDALHR